MATKRTLNQKRFFKTQEKAWNDAIEVDDGEWAALKETATAILVQSSERSTQGAGELTAS